MRSFFQRENEPQPSTPQAAPARKAPAPKKEQAAGRESTHLARGSKVIGEISGTAELVIDGEVEGQIELKNRVVVGGKGRVDGKIVAAAVQVGGKVHGNVRGLERVEVLSSGSLEGDVVSPRVVIAEGAWPRAWAVSIMPAPTPTGIASAPSTRPRASRARHCRNSSRTPSTMARPAGSISTTTPAIRR